MVERVLRRPRSRLRRPLSMPSREVPPKEPVPHIPKKPILASTGTKVDRLCAICLGKLNPGVAITFCTCGKFFHLDCISEVRVCPICQEEMEFSHIVVEETEAYHEEEIIDYEEDIVEEVFQCPLCQEYVDEDAAECKCGAQFDTEVEIYTCPECDAEVEPDASECPDCKTEFG